MKKLILLITIIPLLMACEIVKSEIVQIDKILNSKNELILCDITLSDGKLLNSLNKSKCKNLKVGDSIKVKYISNNSYTEFYKYESEKIEND